LGALLLRERDYELLQVVLAGNRDIGLCVDIMARLSCVALMVKISVLEKTAYNNHADQEPATERRGFGATG